MAACAPMSCSSAKRISLLSLLLLASCAKQYRVTGLVLGVDRAKQTFVVSHNDIHGYMPAMVMPFRAARAAELEPLAPGSRVTFRLVVGKAGTQARNIRKQGGAPSGVLESNGDKIRLETPVEKVPIGSQVPDFTLTDQAAKPVRLSDFKGKVVAVDFIYTRCPLPDVCPRLSANFARLQRRFTGQDLVLLSVSIDPLYDTPEVLSRYAKIWKADPAMWHFLTGGVGDVEAVARRLGMIYWPEEGLMTHTSQTGVIGRNGKLAAIVEGSSYAVKQLGDLIAAEMEVH
jgi:protein SCO1/2